MTPADVFFAAATAGAWALPAAALFAAAWVVLRTARWAVRIIRTARTARVLQQRADRLAAINTRLGHWHIDDATLADQQAGCDRLRNAIEQQREEGQQ